MKQNIFFRAIVAIAMMLIGWLPSLAYDFEVDGVFYKKTSDNAVAVTYKGEYSFDFSNEYAGDVVIPSSVKYKGVTYSVTSIGYWAFRECSSLTSIEIPNSVTSIGDEAFEGCSGLTSVTIDNSVTSIGDGAFYGCSGLTNVIWNVIKCSDFDDEKNPFYYCSNITSFTFGDKVEYIPARLCYGMNKLTSIEISNSVTSIGDEAFFNCSSLTSIEIPNSVTSIGDYAFGYCESLTSIEIPNSVTSIEHGMFTRCSSLISIKIPNSVTSIGEWAFGYCESLTGIEIGNSVTSIGEWAFGYCSSLTSIEIPNSVTSIGDYAFGYCESLTSIEIPNSVTSIERRAFVWCSSLTKITCHATTPPTIESDTFSDYSAELYVPVGRKAAYKSAQYWKNFNIINETLDNPITLNDNNVTVASIGDNIVVKNAKLGSNVRVYAADGAMIATEIVTDGSVVIEAPIKGIYVVAIDGKSFKVMVK